eukprot:1783578-Rhodomonas_salina.2
MLWYLISKCRYHVWSFPASDFGGSPLGYRNRPRDAGAYPERPTGGLGRPHAGTYLVPTWYLLEGAHAGGSRRGPSVGAHAGDSRLLLGTRQQLRGALCWADGCRAQGRDQQNRCGSASIYAANAAKNAAIASISADIAASSMSV